MRSSDPDSRHPAPGTRAIPMPQEDEHLACTIPVLEAVPLETLDWDGLLATGNTPCLVLGAERRTRKRD